MIRKIFPGVITSIFLLSVSACNLLGGPALINGTGQDPTAAVQTQVSALVATTAAAQTNLAKIVQSMLTAMATSTPEFTFTPSLTPTPVYTFTPSFTSTPTFTLTPEGPTVSVSVQTNCRSGPGTAYEVLGIFNVGETAQVVGRSAYNDNWIIKLPSKPAVQCWLWGYYATLSGDPSRLPVVVQPPTPTPSGDFSFAYSSFGVGPGYTCLLFKAKSTGLTWKSYNFTVSDIPQGVTGVNTSNDFIDYDAWCTQTGSVSELVSGGIVTVMAKLNLPVNPTGDNFSATLTLCTGDDQTGTCLTHTLNAVLGP